MVAAQVLRRPTAPVVGSSVAIRARISSKYAVSNSVASPGCSSGLLIPQSTPPSQGRQ